MAFLVVHESTDDAPVAIDVGAAVMVQGRSLDGRRLGRSFRLGRRSTITFSTRASTVTIATGTSTVAISARGTGISAVITVAISVATGTSTVTIAARGTGISVATGTSAVAIFGICSKKTERNEILIMYDKTSREREHHKNQYYRKCIFEIHYHPISETPHVERCTGKRIRWENVQVRSQRLQEQHLLLYLPDVYRV